MGFKPLAQKFLNYSRDQRKEHNPWEIKLWQYLRAKRFFGLNFKRQVVVGNYIVDFSCFEKKLIIELDGGQHNDFGVMKQDQGKQKFLEDQGYRVLHFWNNDIDTNLNGVLEVIESNIGV